MAENEGEGQVQVQARLFTKLKKFHLQDTPYSLPITTSTNELETLLKQLLLAEHPDMKSNVSFDFLISGDFLRTSLKQFIDLRQVSTEDVLDIEYILKADSPTLMQSLLHDDWVSCVDTCSGYVLTGSYDNSISIWNTQGKCLTAVEGHQMPVKSVAWVSREAGVDRFLSSSQDQTILIWQSSGSTTDSDEPPTCAHICRGHAASVDCVAVNPEKNRFASGSWDKSIKIWDAVPDFEAGDEIDPEQVSMKRHRGEEKEKAATTRTPLATFTGHKEPVSCLQWNANNEMYSGGWDHCIRSWDVDTGINKQTLTGTKAILSISYSPLSTLLASGSADKLVRIWDPRSGDGSIVKTSLSSHTGWISCVSFSPTDSNQLVSGSYDNRVKVWDLRCVTSPLYDLEKHKDKVLCASWKQPEMIVSGGADNVVTMHGWKGDMDIEE